MSDSMKAISLHQPWASLVALGVKTLETRSWSTGYRGPLAIHAAANHVQPNQRIGDWWTGQARLEVSGGERAWSVFKLDVLDNVREHETLLPLGAVVATCELVDVVPIRSLYEVDGRDGPAIWPSDPPAVGGSRLWRAWTPEELLDGPALDITDQRPYGDFTPGRYAWILDKITPLDPPVPAKGRQGLWNWRSTDA